MSFQAEHLVECGTCHAVQVINLRQYAGKVVTCTQCGSPFDMADFKKQFEASRQKFEHPPVMKTIEIDLRQLRQNPQVIAATTTAATAGTVSCAGFIFSLVMVGVVAIIALGVGVVIWLSAPNSSPPIFSTVESQINSSSNAAAPAAAPPQSRTYYAHGAWTVSLAFSPDGRFLASGGADGVVRVRDLSAADSTLFFPQEDREITDLAFSPDGERLIAVGPEGVYVLRFPSGEPINVQYGNRYFLPKAVAYSADGRLVAISDSETAVYEAQSGRLVTAIPNISMPDDLIFTPDGTKLITVSWSRPPQIWDVEGGLLVANLPEDQNSGTEVSLAVSADGRYLAYNGYDQVILYDLIAQAFTRLDVPTMSPNYIALSPSGEYVATILTFDEIAVFSVPEQRLLFTVEANENAEALAFSPDNLRLAAALYNGEVQVWDLFPDQPAPLPAAPELAPLAVDPIPLCFVKALANVTLVEQAGSERNHRMMQEGYRAEADGQRAVNGVTWWHLREGAWVRSDLVEEDAQCASLPQK
jgi:WD40 repeat protein